MIPIQVLHNVLYTPKRNESYKLALEPVSIFYSLVIVSYYALLQRTRL